uniref:dnaJ homolog subfamily C member 27-like n=1 Tax=Styela clava TaxID=7725 RepID=UPI0019393150|nr:dnaJ homolog subfamily C member 27-like [Styela clava]
MERQTGHLSRDIREVVNNITWMKVIAIGNANVGKTCLIKHFCESKFSQCYHATVGVDYGFKVQNVNGIPYRVHLWDLSGDEQYYDVRTELYNGTDACFLVYDVTNPSSFESLDNWLKEIAKHGAMGAKVVVVGNKADLRSNRGSIATTEGRKWATSRKLPYYETSALTGDGVSTMFTELLDSISEKKPRH